MGFPFAEHTTNVSLFLVCATFHNVNYQLAMTVSWEKDDGFSCFLLVINILMMISTIINNKGDVKEETTTITIKDTILTKDKEPSNRTRSREGLSVIENSMLSVVVVVPPIVFAQFIIELPSMNYVLATAGFLFAITWLNWG